MMLRKIFLAVKLPNFPTSKVGHNIGGVNHLLPIGELKHTA